jgi:hypothetical protein
MVTESLAFISFSLYFVFVTFDTFGCAGSLIAPDLIDSRSLR